MSHDELEMRFWGSCANTMGEETKQLVYMREMGFAQIRTWNNGGFGWDARGRSIIDIGGGPVSVLLKMENRGASWVIDPGDYPEWIRHRYIAAGIHWRGRGGEEIPAINAPYDLALIYNCLQHCVSPEKVIANARVAAKDLRMFEWIGIPAHEGHPHELSAEKLEGWTGRTGVVKEFRGEGECYGRAWILGGG